MQDCLLSTAGPCSGCMISMPAQARYGMISTAVHPLCAQVLRGGQPAAATQRRGAGAAAAVAEWRPACRPGRGTRLGLPALLRRRAQVCRALRTLGCMHPCGVVHSVESSGHWGLGHWHERPPAAPCTSVQGLRHRYMCTNAASCTHGGALGCVQRSATMHLSYPPDMCN